jgi:AcrR family transcriptional regulator
LARKRARNHDALVAAARRLFIRDGFEATTIAAITEEADLGFGTFYRYFPDKEAALTAVLEAAGREMDDAIEGGDDVSVTAIDGLGQFIGRFVRMGRRNRDLFRLWFEVSFRQGRMPSPRDQGPSPALPAKLLQAVRRIVDRGVRDGEFAVENAAVASNYIASGLFFVLTPAHVDLTDEALSTSLIELACRTLGVAAPSAASQTSGRRGR